MAKRRTDPSPHTHLRSGCLVLLLLAASLGVRSVVAQQPALNAPANSPLSGISHSDTVVDVQIRGNKSLPLEKILPQIRTRVGRKFDKELLEEDVRRLDHTHMFVKIETFWQQVAGGRIVIFNVVERPLLTDVLFVGCKELRKKALQKEAEIKVGDPVDPYAIEEARRHLEEYYQSKGFSRARITLLEGDKPEDRRAIFLIDEGAKQKVWTTKFIGNTIADDGRLQTQIKTAHPFLWLFKGELDRKELDEDVNRLTAYYRGLGFFRARIGRELEFNEKQNWVTVTFVIDEGPRYKIRNISVLGNTKYTSDELLADLKLTRDNYFDQAKMTRDVATMQDRYGGIGYVFADVKADPRFLEEPGQLDLVYNIKEGDRYRVGKIDVNIKGEYPHTRITTILNRLSIKPGDIVDVREIRASERRIKLSGLFETNPATGNAPKIVFSPPDQDGDDKVQVADRPKSQHKPGTRFRGQSPDPPDRDLNITLNCGRYIGPMDEERGTGNVGRGTGATAGSSSSALNEMARNLAACVKEDSPIFVDRGFAAVPAKIGTVPRKVSRDRVVYTQYTQDASQGSPPAPSSQLQWTSAAPEQQVTAPYPAPNTPPPNYSQPVATQAAPVQPAPAYGQQIWPRQGGPERPIDSPQGTYVPGPIFSENSPFRDGPAEGPDLPRALPFSVLANEAMTGRLMLGVGINSDAGLVGQVVLDEQNFDWTALPRGWEDIRNGTAWRGRGQRLRLEAMPGTQLQRYAVTFQDPYMLDTQVSLGLNGFYYTRIYTEYTEQELGGRISLGYQFTPDLSGSIAYRGQKINITNPIDPLLPDLADVINRDLALHGFRATLSHDKRDSAFLPTEGHLIEASFEEVLGSFQYPRGELDIRKYFTLFERPDGSGRHVLTLASRAGITGDNTPIYERYYAGGFSTIRGFQFRGASPREIGPSTGADIAVGGDFMLLASAEYMFPITADDMLRGVVFCDTGTVEPTVNDWSNKYRVAPGFGLRIAVPAMGPAPIALDFAFPVSWQPGDRQEMFSFFMGFGR